jgi:hypothetical protein
MRDACHNKIMLHPSATTSQLLTDLSALVDQLSWLRSINRRQASQPWQTIKCGPLHADVRPASPAVPGREGRRDSEYERCGTPNVFCAVEPKEGRHYTFPTSLGQLGWGFGYGRQDDISR